MITSMADLGDKLKPIPSIWLHPSEYPLLIKYANLAQGPIVEIGTAWGGSACILTLCSNQGVITIDPFEEPLCKVDGWNITVEATQDKINEVLGAESSRCVVWKTTSQYVAELVSKQDWMKFGLVYVDGCHDYDFVRQDVDLWLPKIMSSGYLILHDSQRDPNTGLCGDEGPTRVANELRSDSRVEFLESAYSMTVWRVT